MKNIKRYISLFLAILMALFALSSCSDTGSKTTEQGGDKLNIICTIFPIYDWVKQLLGSHFADADVKMLLDNGVDLHSYSPTVADIAAISKCDVFIYVGGESDSWVEGALKTASNGNMQVINLLETLGDAVKEEEIVNGMEGEDETGDEEETEYDEHVWLSLKNAKIICNAIANKLKTVYPDNSDDFAANLASYDRKLDELDKKYTEDIAKAEKRALVVCDRFPFRYMMDDYGIEYYAAFSGCSAETEASFTTIKFLAEKVDELGLDYVLTIEKATHNIAKTVIESTAKHNQSVLELNSLQSTTSLDASNGVTYLSVMESNLDVLNTVLN